MAEGPEDRDEVSEATRLLVARARLQAQAVPTPGELAGLAFRAANCEGEEQRAALQDLTSRALDKAHEVSFLLGELAGLLGDGGGDGRAEG